MKHFSIKITSTERNTPTGLHPNRVVAGEASEKKSGSTPRGKSRRFIPPRGRSRSQFVGKIYPNGEFTLGFVSKERKKVAEQRYENGQVDSVYATSPEPDEVDTTLGSIPVPQDERLFSPLNLASVANHHTTSVTYGLHGMTPYGKKVVKNIGFMMEREFGRQNVSMGTLTIPQFTEQIMQEICSNWGYCVRAFFQEMKRIYNREGLDWRYCSVTEIQPKRWENYKQVGLHIHFLWIPHWVDWANQWLVTYDEIRAIWRRILQNVVNAAFPDTEEVPSVPNPNFRNEVVQKDASAYMAKYMSKGSDIIGEVVIEKGESYIPSQWWSADTISKELLKSAMIYPSEDELEALMDICEGDFGNLVVYLHKITIERPQIPPLIVGYAGRLNDYGMSALAYLRSKIPIN